MESNKNIVISSINSLVKLTCVKTINDNIIACGDNGGKVVLFDVRSAKPIVKVVNSGNKSDVNSIVLSKFKTDEILFSCNDKIFQCDSIKDTNVKIVSKDKIKSIHCNDTQDEIYDFTEIDSNTIAYANQEKDSIAFVDISKNSIVDTFALSSSYGVEAISGSNVAMYSFNGEILIYDVANKKTKTSKQIKNVFDNSEVQDQGKISNPPYLNKIIFYSQKNEIVCALMNGLLISLSATNLKKKKMKTAHNGSINDVKMSLFDINEHNEVISYGKDKCLKFINALSFDIDCYIEMEYNVIDYDTTRDNSLFFIDDTTKKLYNMKVTY